MLQSSQRGLWTISKKVNKNDISTIESECKNPNNAENGGKAVKNFIMSVMFKLIGFIELFNKTKTNNSDY